MLILLFNGTYTVPVTPTVSMTETWFPGLVTVLQGACSEATAIIKTANMNKTNWENLIKASKLSVPYILVETGMSEQEDWGRDNISWRQSVNIHYVCSTTASALSGGGYDAHQWAESKAINIATAVASYTGSAFHTFNVNPVYNVNEFNGANQVLYSLGVPYIAGTTTVKLLWGASNCGGDLWT